MNAIHNYLEYTKVPGVLNAIDAYVDQLNELNAQGKHHEAEELTAQFHKAINKQFRRKVAVMILQLAIIIISYKVIGPATLLAKIATMLGGFIVANAATTPLAREMNSRYIRDLNAVVAESSAELDALLVA